MIQLKVVLQLRVYIKTDILGANLTVDILVPTWHGVDQVTTQHHEPGPGPQAVHSLHGLLGQLHLLGPFLLAAVAVAVPPGFHQPQLRVRRLDEAKGARPLTLVI